MCKGKYLKDKRLTDDAKMHNFIVENLTYKCPCGHSVVITKDKEICTHCNKYVFKDKETEFAYRLKEKMIKEKRNEKEN